MQHIETVTVGSGGAASITFSAIPQTYTDLYLVLSGRSKGNFPTVFWQDGFLSINGSSSNFTARLLFGDSEGSFVSSISENAVNLRQTGSNATANTFGITSVYIPNYTSAAAKSISSDNVTENNGRAFMSIGAGLWNQNVAITSISYTDNSGLAEFSSASLYGILAGSDGIVSVS